MIRTTRTGRSRRPARSLGALIGALALLGLAGPAAALGAPELDVETTHYPPVVPAGTHAQFELVVSNTGDAPTSGDATIEFAVPAGLEVVDTSDDAEPLVGKPLWACTIAGDSQSVSCLGPKFEVFPGFFFPVPIEPGKEACQGGLEGGLSSCRLTVMVRADENAAPGTREATIEASGGGSAAFNDTESIDVGPLASFDVKSFDGEVLEESGDSATQAGSHPHTAGTEFFATTLLDPTGEEIAVEDIKDVEVELPPGLVGNPTAYPTCTQAQLFGIVGAQQCPPESQVGLVNVWFDAGYGGSTPGNPANVRRPVMNMQRPGGLPALFAFNIANAIIQVYPELRTGEDYGLTVLSRNSPQTLSFEGVDFTFWGVPSDPVHDPDRACPGDDIYGCVSTTPLVPFVTLPTSCQGPGPNNSVETTIELTSWEGGFGTGGFFSHAAGEPGNLIGNTACNALEFEPTLQARPTTNVADAPSGLDVDLHIPQDASAECDPGPPVTCGNAPAHLRDTTVALPQGLVVNPSGANGLGSCSESQFGFVSKEGDVIHTTPDPATCSDASKLGSVEVDSPLVDHPLEGSVHIAAPYANPFGSLLAIYITVNDVQSGLVVKLAGEVHADPNTGQLTTTVLHNPQLPFEDFKLHFFGGAGGPLRTPAACGTYSTESSLTPWTAPEGETKTWSDPWAIETAPGGGTCPTSQGALPNSPDIDAGSISPVAAIATPTVVTLRRDDGTQEFSTVNLTLPPGLTGKLAGVEQCSDGALAAAASKSGNEEKSSPSCPANSRIGTVDVAAGAGPGPYHATGTAYLAGPYKGAPLSMAIVTPAVAGPFDLGTVVVRVALHLNRDSGRITAVSDQIPHILQGIPLDVRSARVLLDRPDFTRNGTSCDPSSFEGSLVSTLSQSVALSERFQLGECTGLAFKPRLGIRLFGGTGRGAHPRLRGVVVMPPGGANIAKASVALPRSEFLDQGHIGTVCTRVQFAAKECPAASVYGNAVATSPLADYTLTGPAYLRSSDHKLPDLVIALKGPAHQPIEVDVVGRIDSVRGGIRTTFEGVPDLPVSKFVLNMQGGKKGLLVNSRNICARKYRATAEFDGQNGKLADRRPLLRNSRCSKQRRKRKTRKHRRHARASAIHARRAVR